VSLLEISDLRIRFGPRPIVEMDRLEVDRAQIVGLAGESGSGKSMTALAVLGLAGTVGAHVEGSIQLDGQELVGLPQRALRDIRGRRVALIFQSPGMAFNPVFRVGRVFMRALELHGAQSRTDARERVTAALRSVFLSPDLLSRYPSQLSGGQLQRISIAMALALRCDLLLADEPTSALDVTVQGDVLELLRGLRDQREMGIMFISHDLAVVAELCDHIAVMRAGRVVEAGPTDRVITQPQNAYTRELLAAVPRIAVAGVSS
jgi:ABC-type glutathione transport system ATPase component